MKKILLIFILAFALVSCDEETTTAEILYPEMSYLSFSSQKITVVSEQLTQEEDVYYLYFYGANCSACALIKNEALYTIEFLTEDTVYFVEANVLSEIHDDISISGTPSLVKIVNGEVESSVTNGTNVLDALHGLN